MSALAALLALLAFAAGVLLGVALRRRPAARPSLPLPLDLPDDHEPASAHSGGTLPWPLPGVSANRAGRNRAGGTC